MDILVKTQINLNELAERLAKESDNKQAFFFNKLFEHMEKSCNSKHYYEAHNKYHYEVQLTSIRSYINNRSFEALRFITGE